MTRQPRLPLIGLILLAIAPTLGAQTPEAERLVVGVKAGPPFVIERGEGVYEGIAIELWEALAGQLGLAYDLRAYELDELLAGLEDGSIDVGLGALTVTSVREAAFDFSHPFYTTGLGIAVDPSSANWWAAVRSIVSGPLFSALAALGLLLLALGAAVWVFERRHNADEFGGGVLQGLGSGFWWAAVTMTTVGYGDKSPRTFGGRFVALAWMFAGVIIISSFTAAITSALTVSRLSSVVEGPEDLPYVRVGTVGGTTSEAYLTHIGIGARLFETSEALMGAVAEGRVEAGVFDQPILRYHVRTDFAGRAAVLPEYFDRQNYAVALPAGSRLREPLNRALLEWLEGEAWSETLRLYLGE